MKIKRQFLLLSLLIISIPILCYTFIIVHTYIHSPNRYLLEGSIPSGNKDFDPLSDKEIENLSISLKMLPQEVEAVIFRTDDHKILYSTMPEISVGTFMEHDTIWNFCAKTSDKYFYQFSKIPSAGSETILMTRLPLEKIKTEERTRYYLKVLLIIILITVTCLIMLSFISKVIFEGLQRIEKSSSQLAEGHLDQEIPTEIHPSKNNEFTNILKTLEKMRRELLEWHTRKNRFVMGISHDLRTPVAIIKGYSEAITDDVINDKVEIKNSVELIEKKATQLEEMIDTLINFMKLNDTEIKEKLVPESITKLITEFAKYVEITGKVFKEKFTTALSYQKTSRFH